MSKESKKQDKAGKAVIAWTKATYGHFVNGLEHIKWEELPDKVKDRIIENPKMSAFQATMLLVTFVPGLVVAPALGVLGFSSVGPAAGSMTAWYQSFYGSNMVFSTLQSAGMGGYGVAAVNGVVSGASTAAGTVCGWFGAKDGKKKHGKH